jgi:preprotein translocase subunit YajC
LASASFFQAVPPAPGRPAAPGAPQPTVQQPPPGDHANGKPPPGAEAPGGLSLMFPLLILVPVLFIMFWTTRSQQKKQQAALTSLKKGDRVLTQSGLVGKLVDLGDRYAKVELAPGVKVEMLKSGLVGKDTGDVQPAKKD